MAHRYHYLNLLLSKHLSLPPGEYRLEDSGRQGLVCHFMGMQLASAFQPVFRADGRLAGHEALLRIDQGEHVAQSPVEAFATAEHSGRLVQFDRLVRTIHLLNHTRHAAEEELLFLKVHPRLLARVDHHGRTFEHILHYYSVPTSRVVIELNDSDGIPEAVLCHAIGNYRDMGYRIALDGLGTAYPVLVIGMQPDIVKLDGEAIRAAERSPVAASVLFELVGQLKDAGICVGIPGIETAGQLRLARQSGAGLVQGYQLGRPAFAASRKLANPPRQMDA
ncbi:MAG: EAL domain-containing protein [Sideroxydans sp.]|nr:EAL domain-containing protein [Sideroxydans sp.]